MANEAAQPTIEGRTIPINFIDIETVPQQNVSVDLMQLFEKKFTKDLEEEMDFVEFWKYRAALYAEFGKIVCISMGRLQNNKFYLKSFHGTDEVKILTDFSAALGKANVLAGHNIEEFDVPFITRRMIINKIPVPAILNTIGIKPWDLKDKFQDTMKMWSGLQWNYKTSLELLCNVLGLPSPKQEMNGKSVGDLYNSLFDGSRKDQLPFDAEEEVFKKISTYCNGDVFASANVYCRLRGYDIITEDQIVYA